MHYNLLTQVIKREDTKLVGQAVAMECDILLTLYAYVDFSVELEAVSWVAVVIGFSIMLQVSNLGAVSQLQFDRRKNFIHDDLKFKKGYWYLTIRWSKTIQHRNKLLEVPLVPALRKEICPVHWINKMYSVIKAQKY